VTYEELEARLAAWAQAQPDVRAVISIGSRARGDADAWSDLDVMIFSTDRDRRAADPAWLHTFGEVWLTFCELMGDGDPEWFALYDGGIKFDASLMDVPPEDAALDLETLLAKHRYKNVFARGVYVLYDRLSPPRRLASTPVTLPDPPTAQQFDATVSELLLETVTAAKFVARGDYWRAQRWLGEFVRARLLALTEWHAYGRDTWYRGRFMERWADPRILAAVPQTFALYQRESLGAALVATLDLARWVGEETATRFGFTYPLAAHDRVAALVAQILGSRA
jgi:aminoglycoside 6-adenylyltransferase